MPWRSNATEATLPDNQKVKCPLPTVARHNQMIWSLFPSVISMILYYTASDSALPNLPGANTADHFPEPVQAARFSQKRKITKHEQLSFAAAWLKSRTSRPKFRLRNAASVTE
jgi:hypothetical protein